MNVLFLTGAGISANAGIATYRDNGSSWTDSDLEAKSHADRYGNHLDELWDKHWGPLHVTMTAAVPTYTHKAIAEFQKKHESIVATQNIDDLHERAGSDNVAHLHGVMEAKCMKCKGKEIARYQVKMGAPVCMNCDSRKTRPDVVLFGELLDKKLMNGLESFAQHPDTKYVIAVGTSLNVWPATGLVFDNVAKSIIINKQTTPMNKWVKKAYVADCDEVIDEVLSLVDNDL